MNENLQIEKWISFDDKKACDFWTEIGNKDVFNLRSGDFSKFEKNIADHGFIKDLERCLSNVDSLGKKIEGTGIELAAGSMWLTAYLLNNYGTQIKKMYALEMSESLLLNLGLLVIKKYQVDYSKLIMCIGSFYEIQLSNESLDFVIMCQAFHHADNPHQLLKEVNRVLKKGGVVIMIGELFISKHLYLKCYMNYLISRVSSSGYVPRILKENAGLLNRLSSKNLEGNFQELYFPPDEETGDHYYLKSQYESFFQKNGFSFVNIKAEMPNHLSYILLKS